MELHTSFRELPNEVVRISHRYPGFLKLGPTDALRHYDVCGSTYYDKVYK